MRKNNVLLVLIFLSTLQSSVAQNDKWFKREEVKKEKKDPLLKVTVQKQGVYFGVQQGLQTIGELGGIYQYKRVKLKKPITLGATLGIDYNLPENVMGFNLGAWRKSGRIKFTYGANVLLRTNFSTERIGLGPAIGYKFSLLHLQAGYTFLSNRNAFDTNELFILLRFNLMNERKTTVTRRKKKQD